MPATLLVVDDEPSDLEFLRTHLTPQGYEVLSAANGYEALRVYREHAQPIALLITDVAMAPVGGIELAEQLQEIQPELKEVFASGYAGAEVLRQADFLGTPAAFLSKPFTAESLLRKVREMLGYQVGLAQPSTAASSGSGQPS
jgi:CheY-like chemotaxis protein